VNGLIAPMNLGEVGDSTYPLGVPSMALDWKMDSADK
jgi:hypothetical protein